MKLSKTTKYLHIIIAVSMIMMLSVGLFMSETEAFSLYPIHKSVGVIVFCFALIRIAVRIKEGWPESLGDMSLPQKIAAKVVHWGLIIMTALFPISGMMMSAGGGHGIYIFGIELVASNINEVTGKAIALNETAGSLGHTIHESLTWVLIIFIIVHVAGALKHHLIDKDETIKRMFSFK